MSESEDTCDGVTKPVRSGNIKAFISQFDNQPMRFPNAKPAPAKPNIPKKPPGQPPVVAPKNSSPVAAARNGLKPVIPKDIASRVGTLKHVESKTSEAAEGDSSLPKKQAIVPPVLKPKPLGDKENKPPAPEILHKKPFQLNSSSPVTNGGGGGNIEELKNRLKKTQPEPKPLPPKKVPKTEHKPSPVLPKKETPTEPEFDGDTIYTSPAGVQYRALKMTSSLGPAPVKPSLPPHPDLYEFQVEDAEDDDLYEMYNDTRVVSMIPTFDEEDELQEAPQQEEYTDTELPSNKERPLSMQDEEYYEPLDEAC